MSGLAAALATTALLGAVVAAGCGIGPGEGAEGEAQLTITRDYGAEVLGGGTLTNPTPSDTVVRFLDEEADVETSYGGNFVDSIDGLAGGAVAGGDHDWFFFVNGIYSDVGAGESRVRVGDRIWWDYRRWAEAYRVPAVVGSWPEPFLNGYAGERWDVTVECLDAAAACDEVVSRLRDAGADAEVVELDEPENRPDELRVLVGEWERVRADPAARAIESGPGESGVYAEMQRCPEGWDLTLLGDDARPRRQLAKAGLVAAVQRGGDPATWLVTATDQGSLDDAAGLLDEESLANRYAVAVARGDELAIPAPAEGTRPGGGECS